MPDLSELLMNTNGRLIEIAQKAKVLLAHQLGVSLLLGTPIKPEIAYIASVAIEAEELILLALKQLDAQKVNEGLLTLTKYIEKMNHLENLVDSLSS